MTMKWSGEAEAAIKKIPFFVRKKVRARVEREAKESGKPSVSIDEVRATQTNFISKMDSEIKGYNVDTCFGPGGCPNRAVIGDSLIKKIERLLKNQDLVGFLRQRVNGKLKFHHEFRITIAECPNACSQPQIKDIGIIGAITPEITDKDCVLCSDCVDACREKAITINIDEKVPKIDMELCLKCGECARVCPSGTISEVKKGWKALLGGKLGRHPTLARELPGIYDDDQVLRIIKDSVDFYKETSKEGERFVEIFKDKDCKVFKNRYLIG